MGWEQANPYEYHPERGLYYHEVARNLICGSQPQTREDIEHLHHKECVTNIVNLQVRHFLPTCFIQCPYLLLCQQLLQTCSFAQCAQCNNHTDRHTTLSPSSKSGHRPLTLHNSCMTCDPHAP